MSSISPADLSELFHTLEGDIVEVLSTTDLQSLSKDLQEYVVITKEANKVFESLDHDKLKSRTRARYLLSLIVDSLPQGRDTFTRFIRVLSARSGACKHLATKLNKQVSPSRTSESLLHESDLEFLLEFLISCSYRWEELGVMLKLPRHVIEECSNKNTNKLKLKQVLDEWLTGYYKDAKETTLESLKAALDSKTVACRDLALSLKEKYEANLLSRSESTEALAGADTGSLVIYQSSDVEVADHKSALLEVQVKKTSEPVSYQWMKDGQPLTDSFHFSDTTTAILLINQASLGAEGEYSSQVRCGQDHIDSTSVKLKVQYPQNKKSLIDWYLYSRVISDTSRPFNHCDKFVDLTLVKKYKIKRSSLLIEQEMEALLVNQEKIEYDSAFGEYTSGSIILVEGRPGSGKTTLANKIVKDWSQGKALRNADQVFLIPLRRNLTKTQIFELFYHGKAQRYTEDIEESQGEMVCFVLDGYDEFNPNDKNSSIIEDICRKIYLPKSMVIITARLEAAFDLRLVKPNLIIEILGFTKEGLECYVKYYLENSGYSQEEKIKKRLTDYVRSSNNVLNICHLPINASIICFLFSQHLDDKLLPRKESQIYEALVVAIALHQIGQHGPLAQLHSLKDLSGQDKKDFSEICKLAFNMTMENQLIFTKLPSSLISLKESPFRGLFTVDPTIKLEQVYSFNHLTLQEYLGAYHLASLDTDQQTEFIKKHTGKCHMATLFKFYCGLIKYTTNSAQFHCLFEHIPKYNVLHLVHCAYESQEPDLCKTALRIIKGIVDISYTMLTPADFTALAYVFSCAPQEVTEVNIDNCHLYEDCVDQTLKRRSLDIQEKCDKGIQSFISGFTDMLSLADLLTYTTVSYLTKSPVLSAMKMLEERKLYIYHYRSNKDDYLENTYRKMNNEVIGRETSGDSGYIMNFMKTLLKCTNLHTLMLGDFSYLGNPSIAAGLFNFTVNLKCLTIVNVTATNMIRLGEGLQYCKNLKLLLVASSVCDHEGCVALANGLQHCKSLSTLKICNTMLGPKGAEALARGLKCLQLKDIALMNCAIGSEGLLALTREEFCSHAKGLILTHDEHMTLPLKMIPKSISHLVLKDNHINSNGIAALVKQLTSCCGLQYLQLNYNPIGPEGAAELGKGLNKCNLLSELHVAGCSITSDGLSALVHGFQNWTKLTHLDLTDNDLCSEALTSLSRKLHLVPRLSYLYLSHNNIDYRGARALAGGIQKCPSICVLNISHNNIGSIGAAAIANSLNSKTIAFVNFSDNSVDLENELLLINLVKLANCRNFELLDLSNDKVGPDNTLRLIICLIFHLKVLNITTEDMAPETLEFVTTFKKVFKRPKLYINN